MADRLTRLPIRWRLTVWYAALLGAALTIFAVALYFGMRYRLYHLFDEQLRSQAQVTLSTVLAGAPTPRLSTETTDNDENFVRLFDADGEVVSDSSPSLDDAPPEGVRISRLLVARALAGQTSISSDRVGGDVVRIITAPVREDGTRRVVGVLQVGLVREEFDEALTQLLGSLILALPLVLLAATGGGYLLAGRALKPVATITALAASIGGDQLDARLNLDLPPDELGTLANTFDRMLGRIEEAFERQRRFTGDAAHELRTPLSLMRGQVDLALARPRTVEEYQEALRDLDQDLGRLTGLVGTLLTLARADTGKLTPELSQIDLADTVGVVLEQYSGLATDAAVSLQNEAAPAIVAVDEDLIIQVLVNLIDNALAHTPAGGTIAVGCRADAAWARLWVSDTGAGIAVEHQARVFDRFYRVDSGRTRAHGGAGLGLSISWAIAEAHGGKIALTSSPGEGSRFEVVLPKTKVAIQRTASQRATPTTGPGTQD